VLRDPGRRYLRQPVRVEDGLRQRAGAGVRLVVGHPFVAEHIDVPGDHAALDGGDRLHPVLAELPSGSRGPAPRAAQQHQWLVGVEARGLRQQGEQGHVRHALDVAQRAFELLRLTDVEKAKGIAVSSHPGRGHFVLAGVRLDGVREEGGVVVRHGNLVVAGVGRTPESLRNKASSGPTCDDEPSRPSCAITFRFDAYASFEPTRFDTEARPSRRCRPPAAPVARSFSEFASIANWRASTLGSPPPSSGASASPEPPRYACAASTGSSRRSTTSKVHGPTPSPKATTAPSGAS